MRLVHWNHEEGNKSILSAEETTEVATTEVWLEWAYVGQGMYESQTNTIYKVWLTITLASISDYSIFSRSIRHDRSDRCPSTATWISGVSYRGINCCRRLEPLLSKAQPDPEPTTRFEERKKLGPEILYPECQVAFGESGVSSGPRRH